MIIKHPILALYVAFLVCSLNAQNQAVPKITGSPLIKAPNLLAWKTDFKPKYPDLTEPTSNRIYDLHLQVNDCSNFDFILSTSGNYHMALTEFWYDFFLPKYEVDNFYFSTSPPIGVEQTKNAELSYGNVALNCKPFLIVGPKAVMDSAIEEHLIINEPIELFSNQGNVLLVKKGNPKQIQTVWDLAREDVVLATSNPYTEPGSFGNYANTIYNIALSDKNEKEANLLFQSVFNNQTEKWVAGKRIHHREVPHLIYSNEADVAMVFYHLARYFVESFPETFEIVPLGGTIEVPKPLLGNKVATLYLAKVDVPLSKRQEQICDAFVTDILSGNFDSYLSKHFLIPAQR